MTALLRRLLAPYGSGEDRIVITGDDLTVDPSAITSIALIFHELATNADWKHAFLHRPVKQGTLNAGGRKLSRFQPIFMVHFGGLWSRHSAHRYVLYEDRKPLDQKGGENGPTILG
jgi:hypothetical protein